MHADTGVCPELTDKHVQHAMLALSTYRNGIESVCSILESRAEHGQYSSIFGSITHTAAMYGHFEIFRLLHQNGADINGPAGGWRGNCLQTAALGGHAEIVRLMLTGNLGLDLQRNDYKPRLDEYLDCMPGHRVDNDLMAAILCAIRSGNDMVVEDLLKQVEGLPLQLADRHSHLRTSHRILGLAMKTCRETCLQTALRGIRYESTILAMALSNAICAENQTQVNQILAASAWQEPQPDWTRCALEFAADFGLVEYLNVVLAHGDTISPRSAARMLCSILLSRHHDIVHILIARRIGLPYGGDRPIPLLCFGNGPRLRPIRRLGFVMHHAPLSAAACPRKNIEFFQTFINNGTSLTYNDAGVWALNVAAWAGNVAAVQILLEAGVDAAAGMPTDPSWTPVKLAAINGHESVAQLPERSGQEKPVIDGVQGRELFTGRTRRRKREHDNDNAT